MSFRDPIIIWYNQNKRDLPWRDTADPYRIWLSEIIMQQTRVEQGLPYYLRFCERFPTVKDLALASLEEVLKLWQGLGYYTRARNLHETARIVHEKYNGVFPSSYAGLLELKGIGDYSASAIASIAFGLPYPVIDGNVIRFISRYLAIAIPVDNKQLKQDIRTFLLSEIDAKSPAIFNQALMEIGAMVCKPQNPACNLCPVSEGCLAAKNNQTGLYPVKAQKAAVRNRYFIYFVIRNSESVILLKKRTENDIWKGLYDFPLLELSEPPQPGTDDFLNRVSSFTNAQPIHLKSIQGPLIHLLSHQRLNCWFLDIACDFEDSFWEHHNYIPVNFAKLAGFPVPRLIERFIHQFLTH